jgi:hypothetical protein
MKAPGISQTVVCALGLASVLLCFLSCTPKRAQTSAPELPRAALTAFPAPLPGDKTPGVIHVLEVLDLLSKYDRGGRNQSAQIISFQFPENEINEYLAYSLRMKPRPGISRAAVKLLPENDISALIEIDFEALRKWNSWIIPTLLQPLLNGRQAIEINAQFEAQDGVLHFVLQDAYGPGGTAILKTVGQDIMQSIGLHQPEWYDTSRPIPLPLGLRRVWTQKQSIAGET